MRNKEKVLAILDAHCVDHDGKNFMADDYSLNGEFKTVWVPIIWDLDELKKFLGYCDSDYFYC